MRRFVLIAAVALAQAQTVLGQTTSIEAQQSGYNVVEEVIVTARKRSESLSETPVAISAFSELAMQQKSIQGMQDIAYLTPGLTFESFVGANLASPTIRGMTQSRLNNREQNVSTFIDGIYLQSQGNIDVSLLELERVEVIKGPQSALYGRNSFAGAINYITKKPEAIFSATADLTLGSDGRDERSLSLNMPIGERVIVNVAASDSEFDGTFRNSHPSVGKPGLLDDHIGGWEKEGVIFGLSVDPIDALSITARHYEFEAEFDIYPFINLYPDEHDAVANCGHYMDGLQEKALFCGEFNQKLVERATQQNTIAVNGNRIPIDPRAQKSYSDTELTSFDLHYDFTEELAFQFSYADSELSNGNLTAVDGDQVKGTPATGFFQVIFPPEIGPLDVTATNIKVFFAIPLVEQHAEQFEARFSGYIGDRIQWSGGAYHSTVEETNRALFNITEPPEGDEPIDESMLLVLQASAFEDQIAAAFVSADYEFNDNLTLSAELRKTEEVKEVVNQPSALTPTASESRSEEEYAYSTWRFIADYVTDDGSLYYASLAKGVKGGGFNPDGTSYDEEDNITLELGTKFEWRELRANVSLFYTDWNNLQIPVPDANGNPVTVTGNLDGGAEVKGLEFDAQYPLLSSLRLDIGLALNDAEYDRDAVNSSLSGACSAQTVCSIYIGGNRLPRQSDFTYNLGIQYFGELFGGIEYFARIDSIYQSDQFASDANIATIEERELLNFRTGISNRKQGWSLDAWVKNLADREYVSNATVINSSDNVRQSYGPVLGARRTSGITFKYHYE